MTELQINKAHYESEDEYLNAIIDAASGRDGKYQREHRKDSRMLYNNVVPPVVTWSRAAPKLMEVIFKPSSLIRDISAGGACMLLEGKDLSIGEDIILHFSEGIEHKAIVRWVASEITFNEKKVKPVGIQFKKRMTESEIMMI